MNILVLRHFLTPLVGLEDSLGAVNESYRKWWIG